MATGMITRHFEHPSGATATLEMPAGWSRNCYYILTTFAATKNKLKATGQEPDVGRRTFGTPEEARQGAIAQERLALANGWRPRMASGPIQDVQQREWHFYRPTGEQIPINLHEIEDISVREREWHSDQYGDYTRPMVREKRIRFSGNGRFDLQPGERFLLVQRDRTPVQTTSAFFVQSTNTSYSPDEPTTIDVQAVMTKIEPGESEAIDRWHDREAIVQAGVETDTNLVELWNWLGTRIQDTSERQQVNAAIIRGRAERQARLQREEEVREIQQREQTRRAIEAAAERTSRPIIGIPITSQQKTEETLRRLSGGTDLSKPKKRKIDLGD